MVNKANDIDKTLIKENKLKQEKLDLIRQVQELQKLQSEPLSSKKVGGLNKKAIRLFGSWSECILQSGLQQNRIVASTLTPERRDNIFENIIRDTVVNKKVRALGKLTDIQGVPSKKGLKKIIDLDWAEIVKVLDLEKTKKYEINKLSDQEIYRRFKDTYDKLENKTLFNYSFNDIENNNEFIPYIYIMERFEINWKWWTVACRHEFKSLKDIDTRIDICNQEDLINVLTFKYLLNGKQLNAIQINSDRLLPSVNNLMQVFNMGMYEIWLLVEKNIKTYC